MSKERTRVDDSVEGLGSTVSRALAEFVKSYYDESEPDVEEFLRKYSNCTEELRILIEDFLFAAEGARLKDQRTEETRFESVGPYRIINKIGEGGMGIVYLAEQENPKRRVALKMVKLFAALSGADETYRRFELETHVLGQLSHPGIAQIYDAGVVTTQYGDQPYFAMEYIDGEGLLDSVKKNGLRTREILQLFQRICDAVQFAHNKGYVHRDLKPGNILIGKDGSPKILDFGLAQATEYDESVLSQQTATGVLVGTLQYMSPEQCAGSSKDVDSKSDVYSLGVILYTLLTGKLPYDLSKKTLPQAVRIIQEEEPVRPRSTSKQLSVDLDVIVMKSLEKSTSRRYQAARELQEDIRRYLSNEPILARPPSNWYRVTKFSRRHQGIVGGLVTSFLALSIGTGLAVWKAVDAEAARRDAVFAQGEEKRQKEAAITAGKEAERQHDEVLRLSDIMRLQELLADSDQLWPAHPDKIAEMEEWQRKASELALRVEIHQSSLAELRCQAIQCPREGDNESRNPDGANGKESAEEGRLEIGGWKFADTEAQWRHNLLEELVTGLLRFTNDDPAVGEIASVDERLKFAAAVESETIKKYEVEWADSVASIRNECQQYNSLEIRPQIGLVPIGRDPYSGLWEFAHTQSGEIPDRNENGKLVLNEKTGLVFVLIPGGTFRMGAQSQDPEKPNFDPDGDGDEGPVHEVKLAAFFLSKYEMTQWQWSSHTGNNPSNLKEDNFLKIWSRDGEGYRANVPVDRISFEQCTSVLGQIGMILPTEAQWEYAARAKTDTIFWCGDTIELLQDVGNISDSYWGKMGRPDDSQFVASIDDGFAFLAPVGSFRGNAFGLHDTIGNVWEWCRGGYVEYDKGFREGDGDRKGEFIFHVYRGGGFRSMPFWLRSAQRATGRANFLDESVGIRPVWLIQRGGSGG